MTTLEFTKMHGLGNDFVVLDGLATLPTVDTALVRRLANRRFGIGCDQVLVVEPATHEGADFRYRIFNADGTEVEHCGNGVRCAARFLRERGHTDAERITFETVNGRATVTLREDGLVTVDMGPPVLEPAEIPYRAPNRRECYDLDVRGERLEIRAVSMGNPHAVLFVPNVDTAPVSRLGPRITVHPDFPHGVNVGFLQILDAGHVRLRVHERGVGETLACGTGACAAVVAGRRAGRLGESVGVALSGGNLVVHWAGEGEPVYMTGPAVTVFEGRMGL